MENQRQKWVNLTLLAFGGIVAAIAYIGLTKITAVYNLESTVKQIDLIVLLSSLAFGAALGLGFYLNDKSNAFLNEVVLELSRVTWPAQRETSNATVWVILFVIVAGAVLGALDSLWSWAIKLVL